MNNILYFLVQKDLLLASQEANLSSRTFFHIKNYVPTESNRSFRLVISGVRGGELGVVLYDRQNVFGLVLEKKLLPLITELVVTLNHLGVIHLRRPQKITNCVTPNPLHLQT